MSDTLVGRKLGQYELRDMLGRGGMAVVYRAAQPRVARDVAIKVIAGPDAKHPSFIRRFEHEVRAAARLQHPHILPVYDVGVESNQLYMVMAYLPGGSLSRKIAAAPGGLSLEDTVCIVAQVASALDYAHSQGVIHRDVKSGNIMLDGRGNAYLGDFGIAQLIDGGSFPAMGTIAYLAPELLDGQPASSASDIYALGVVAFEMLAGARPYEAHDRASLEEAQVSVMTPDVRAWRPDLPPGVQVVLGQALNHDPEGRPPHATALAHALQRAAGISGLPCAHLVEGPPILSVDDLSSVVEEDDWPSGHDTPSPLESLDERSPDGPDTEPAIVLAPGGMLPPPRLPEDMSDTAISTHTSLGERLAFAEDDSPSRRDNQLVVGVTVGAVSLCLVLGTIILLALVLASMNGV